MLSLKLNNGKYVHIDGQIFLDFYPNGDVGLTTDKQSLTSTDLLEENFYKTEPSYLKSEPTPVVKQSELPKRNRDLDLIKEGKSFFQDFIDIWKKNWNDENADQPDRGDLLINTMNDFSLPIFKFIRSVGGLTHAVMHTTPPSSGNYADLDYRRKCRLYAENIAQVSSILCPPLGEFLEYPFSLKTKIGE